MSIATIFTSEGNLIELDRIRQADGFEVGIKRQVHVRYFIATGLLMFLISIFVSIFIVFAAKPNVSEWMGLIYQNYVGYGLIFFGFAVIWGLICALKVYSTISGFAGIYTYALSHDIGYRHVFVVFLSPIAFVTSVVNFLI